VLVTRFRPAGVVSRVAIDVKEVESPLKSSWLWAKISGGAYGGHRARTPQAWDWNEAQQRFAGTRVLLVEDNVINQKVGSRLLEKFGCRVDIAANGFEAVQMAGQLPYDLIFMDCQMPEMDGFQACRQIRMLGGALRKVGIVALTAAATPEDRRKCLDSGMNEYLTKPVTLEMLHDTLERWCGAPLASVS
jgi:CheY-like chemotaxis protein